MLEKMEGYKEGIIVEVFPVIQAHKNKNGIYDLNVKTKCWASKNEKNRQKNISRPMQGDKEKVDVVY